MSVYSKAALELRVPVIVNHRDSLYTEAVYVVFTVLCVCVFQWQILDDTSLPLSSKVPGVRVQPVFDEDVKQFDDGGDRGPTWSEDRHHAGVTGDATVTMALGGPFYDFLPPGDSKFGCLAYTLDGRRNVHYFTIHKI